MNGWQPIETAPKGKKVIVYYLNRFGNSRTVVARYYVTGSLQNDPDSYEDVDEYAPEGWYEETESHESVLPLERSPTHWMPLPEPPKE